MTQEQTTSIGTTQSKNRGSFDQQCKIFSDTTMERIAFVILLLWIMSPILAMLFSNLSPVDGIYKMVYKLYYLTAAWYWILMITGFFGCILGIIAVIKSIKKVKENPIRPIAYLKSNLFPLLLLLLFYWSILSFLTAGDTKRYLIGGYFIRDGILSIIAYSGFFCCGYLIRHKKLVLLIMQAYAWIAVLQSILMMANIQSVNEFLCLTPGSSAFSNINHFAYYLCMGVMVSILLLEVEKKSLLNFIIGIARFSIISAALIYNGSLGPFLATIVALIGSLILAIWLDRSRVKLILLVSAIFLFITVMINLTYGYLLTDMSLLGSDFMNVLNGMECDSAGSGRWILWKNSVQYISAHPIFGCSPGHYTDVSQAYYGIGMRPHNEILEYASSIGILGALFYLSALLVCAIEFIKKRKAATALTTGLLCIVMAYLASSLFGVTMYYTSPFFFLFLGIASKNLRETKLNDVQVN